MSGDLRFSSHHDMMRVVERIFRRAGIQLRYSQGFNPRPIMSLSVPRPVGVVSDDDRLVTAFDNPVDLCEIVKKLNSQCPIGLKFSSARELKSKTPPQPAGVKYQLTLTSAEVPNVSARICELNQLSTWPVKRIVKSRRNKRREEPTTKDVDLKPRLADLRCNDNVVSFTCLGFEGSWAKPREIMGLIGLEDIANVSRLKRLEILDSN